MTFQESETVELKSIVADEIKKTILAFANGNGGMLYIGVQDDGSVAGVADPDRTALQVSNMVRDSIKPDLTLFLHYQTLQVDGKSVVAVEVQRGTQRPYYIAKKGLRPEGVYVRQGYSSVPATDTMIRFMIKETDGDRFETMRSLEQELTFEAAQQAFSRRAVRFAPAQMKTLGVMSREGVYTNLGLLLSDQCVHTLKAAVFEGTSRIQFKDRREFTGSLFRQMEEAYEYIDFRNQLHSSFDKLYRIDRRDYPETAVREALLNLLIHRDYSFGASAFVNLYSDRIEFISIGGLVSGVTLSDIAMGISVCRNEKLADVFYRLELVEAYGTGIPKIMESYAGTGRTPKMEVSDNAFKLILPNLNTAGEVREAPAGYGGQPGEEDRIMGLLRTQYFVTRRDVQELLGLGQTTCGRLLKQMLDDGRIAREGRGKNTRYFLPRR